MDVLTLLDGIKNTTHFSKYLHTHTHTDTHADWVTTITGLSGLVNGLQQCISSRCICHGITGSLHWYQTTCKSL